jgi:outer membrane protein assembly factor BamA
MRRHLTRALIVVTYFTVVAYAQCANDDRSDEHGGILVTNFIVNGTTALSATEVARLEGHFVGSCFDDDSKEMGERLREEFQDRGYFAVEVKSLGFKPGDPLGIPKPVTVETEVAEGPKYKVTEERQA